MDLAIVSGAYGGCFIAICKYDLSDPRFELPNWVWGADIFDELDNEFSPPDLSIDPENGMFTVINSSHVARSYFITIGNCEQILSAQGIDLLDDPSVQLRREYVTFIVLLPPMICLELVILVPRLALMPGSGSSSAKKKKKKKKKFDLSLYESIDIVSDVQDYVSSVDIPIDMLQPFDMDIFPLLEGSSMPIDGWLCTQSSGGELTHFAHPSTYHAIDFRCDVGTPVVAIFRSEVIEVRKESSCTGVHVSNLFSWNSILLKMVDQDIYVEYVHINREGVTVSVGEVVEKGHVICFSGDAGFCPEPHLHMQIHRSSGAKAPSVPITYKGNQILAGLKYPNNIIIKLTEETTKK